MDPEGASHYYNIFAASIDGSHYYEVTHLRGLPESAVEPVWSPDAELAAVGLDVPHNGLGIAKSDGSGTIWLTEKTVAEFSALSLNVFIYPLNISSIAPVWYPDGSKLLFLVTLRVGRPTSLYRVNRDGTGPSKTD